VKYKGLVPSSGGTDENPACSRRLGIFGGRSSSSSLAVPTGWCANSCSATSRAAHLFVSPQMSAGYAPEQDEIMKEESARAKEDVQQVGQRLRAAHFDVETRVAQGEARIGILDVAAQWRPDLILLGSHGRRGLRRFLLGSVAEFVSRHADCSVEIVRLPAES